LGKHRLKEKGVVERGLGKKKNPTNLGKGRKGVALGYAGRDTYHGGQGGKILLP